MTQREYAVNLVNALSEQQLQTLISFITGFSDSDTADRVKKAKLAASERSKSQSFKRLKQIIRSVPVDDEKEVLAKCREEKYGN